MKTKIKAIDLKPKDVIYWRTGNSARVISVEIRELDVLVVCGGNVHVYGRELKKNQVLLVERD